MKQHDFQVGDVVECIDTGNSIILTIGTRYTVEAVVSDKLKLVNIIDLSFFKRRFILVESNYKPFTLRLP